MSAASNSLPVANTSLLRPIVIGGAVAGTLDLTSAFITFGPDNPHIIAAGLIGLQASRNGGAATWILGVLLHFFIAFSIATLYCMASRKLTFLRDHWLVCGMFYGMGAYIVMTFVVLPLCAFHFAGPYQLRGILQGVLAHMIIIALPISYSLRKFGN